MSVRVPSPSIRQSLEKVQKWMVQHDAEVQSALTSLNKLHITLSVICLESGEEQESVLYMYINTRKLMDRHFLASYISTYLLSSFLLQTYIVSFVFSSP